MAKEKSHDTSLRADMEAAMEEVESGAEKPAETEVESTPEHAESESPVEAATETKTEVSEPVETAPATEIRAEVDRKQPAREVKAPVDWTPALREKWKGVDPEVREWIHNRQVQTDQLMQSTAAARKFADEFVRVSEPYRPLMAAEGVQNPLQAYEGLMRVTATLAMGSQQQKAQTIANFVKHYNIDIETLDQALAGSLPAPDPQRTALEQMIEQKLSPVNQLLERVNYAEHAQQQQIYGQAHQSIEQFGADPRNEFFEDVRYDMADMLDFASQRGRPMSLKQAYDMCCAQHEGVQQVMATRAQPRTLRDKRSAASSIASRGTEGNHSTERSLREELEAQWGDDARIA